MSGLGLWLLPLLAAGAPRAADGGAAAALDAGLDGGTAPIVPFEPAATAPLPTFCGPETEAAKSSAHFRGAARQASSAADKLKSAPTARADTEEVKAFLAENDLYQRESAEYRNEIQLLVQKRFDERRSQMGESYELAIRKLEGSERTERLDAIARFEAFLLRYPVEPRYSADASFRLAELYYEKGQDDYTLALDAFQQKLKDFQAGKTREEPPQPSYDFTKAVAVYKRMLEQFPDYKHTDAVYYLLGYCEEQMNAHDEADQAFAELTRRFPKSRFVPEAYLRQGESYFDTAASDPRAELQKAVTAYLKVLEFPDQPLFDKAIYKLGWAYYRLDDFPNAVDAFVKLLDFYHSKKSSTDGQPNDLEKEALQYTAICFADDKWGGMAQITSYFAKIGPRPYEKDLYKRLGDILYDQTKNDDAVAAYKLAIAKDPLAADAPLIQAKIIQTYERDRSFDKQTAERDRLVSLYGEGSAWAKANQDRHEAIIEARDLTERALRDSAIYHLQQAIAYQKDKKVEQAFTEFKVAARALGEYLQLYPHTRDVYELTFYHAEALYNSLQFLPAARAYQEVRDMTIDYQYEKEAAHDTVLAYQNEIEREQKQGQLSARPVLKSVDRKDAVPKSEIMTPIYVDFVRSSDTFVNLYPRDDLAPAIAYRAAESFYVFNQFDEARCRFKDIITRYPRNEVAQYAANLTIESYLATKDWANVTAATAELLKAGSVIQKGSELEKTLVKFQLAGIFKLAQQEMDAGHYDKGAELFIELVAKDPGNEFADKALNNAAVCYENVRRFDSALRVYERIIAEYPKSALADQAVFRVASDAEQSYDFDKAVSRYLLLVDRYPNSKNRAGALYNAARLLEGLQRYPEAAQAYKRYAELFPDEADAPQNLFRAALVFEKEKDYPAEIKAFQEFDKKLDKVKAQAELTIQARLKIAQAYEALGRQKERLAQLKDTVAAFDRAHLESDKGLGADAAAEAAFDLLEEQFQAYDRQKIYGAKKVLERSFKDKTANAKKLRDAYADLVRFKRPQWILAAFYRKANVLEHFANSIYDAPVPPEVKHLGDEAIGIYQDALAQKATSLEAQAVDDYIKTLDEAHKLHIVNTWTKKTLESLNHYRPKDYPLLKEAKERLDFEVRSPEPLDGNDGPRGQAVTQEGKLSGGTK